MTHFLKYGRYGMVCLCSTALDCMLTPGCLSHCQPLYDKASAVLTLPTVKHSQGNVLLWWHIVDS